MTTKLKAILLFILAILGAIVALAALIITAGKSKTIIKLFDVITQSLANNVETIQAHNEDLNAEFNKLSAQEKAIINTIKNSPEFKLPPEIDRNDYQSILKWFREREAKYE